jgi:hypothetical protein
MCLKRAIAPVVLLLLLGLARADVIFSNDNIECCSLWQSAVVVTKAEGAPYSNCKILVSVMETRGGIETTLGRYTYFTDSKGKAVLSYTPKKPGERLKISVVCGENVVEKTLMVTGDPTGPTGPQIDFQLPSIETGQIAAVVFIIFAAIFVSRGRTLVDAFRKATARKAPAEKRQEAVEEGTEMRRPIIEHERKAAAKLARKHKRKEIKLGHEFMRKL